MNGELEATIVKLMRPGMGILAADESLPTIAKRFQPLGIANTEENRRAYRSLLFTTWEVEEFISGTILFEETFGQRADDGTPMAKVLEGRGIVPGIKVDRGTTLLVNAPGDLITRGLDGLPERLRDYKTQGARFAKWREVYGITDRNPTPLGIEANADALAAYAAICQAGGIVPIVESEVLIDGDHTIERSAAVTEEVLHAVFRALHRYKVIGMHGFETEHCAARKGLFAQGDFGTGCGGHCQSPATNCSCSCPGHLFSVRRPASGGGNVQPQRDECPVS